MFKPKKHQQEIIDLDPKKYLLGLGTGGMKTSTALWLAGKKVLVVAPKMQVQDGNWERDLAQMDLDIDLTVISKEYLRMGKLNVAQYMDVDTIIFDEVHHFVGVRTGKKRVNKKWVTDTSQLFAASVDLVKTINPERVYLCSATPASNPMAVWGLSELLGRGWSYTEFRETFYEKNEYIARGIWQPKTDPATQERLIKATHSLGVIIPFEELFDVPEQTHKVIYVEPTTEQLKLIKKKKRPGQSKPLSEIDILYPDELVKRTKKLAIENGIFYNFGVEDLNEKEQRIVKKTDRLKCNKIDHILELSQEFKKILIFSMFTGQVDYIADELRAKGKKVVTLTGATKDQGAIIAEAEASESCYVIAQAGISSGYALKSFRCTIFALLSNKHRDYVQGLGRMLRGDNLHKNLFVYLVLKGGVDEDLYKTIMNKQDYHLKLQSYGKSGGETTNET